MISYQGPAGYPGVVDLYKWPIIADMKCGLDMSIVRPVICALLAAVMLALGCAAPAQEPGSTGNGGGVQNHWDKAVAELSAAINMDQVFALAYHLRGLTYYYQGEYDKAIVEYTKAIELDPRFATCYFNRGLIYDRLGEYDKAIADYTRVIEIDPGYAQAYNHRSLVYYDTGQYDKFKDDIKRWQELMRPKGTLK